MSHVLATSTSDGSDGIVEGTLKKTVSEQRAQALGGDRLRLCLNLGSWCLWFLAKSLDPALWFSVRCG